MRKSRKSESLPPIRVRREPPTVDEAIVAAQGLTDKFEQQVEIAAELMGIPEDEVRPLVQAASARRGSERLNSERLVTAGPSARPTRVVVVERRSRIALNR